ncbi:hypothetical protein PI124_g583 [Phytophthora idaei]|nr:hypothetical protein PI125_g640 [Phytophthora idaei]KAG3169436.1 hypothetical protein PI126_g2857 [Phytophthora idaei]KAG3254807.1 hypothetical protein PI124_g583 [Phytophthora idaei]
MTAGVGSSPWMVPEVMMGKRYGEKADVLSLGAVISELDTHELPYFHAKEGNSDSSDHPLPGTAVLQKVSMGKLRVRFSPFMDPDQAQHPQDHQHEAGGGVHAAGSDGAANGATLGFSNGRKCIIWC